MTRNGILHSPRLPLAAWLASGTCALFSACMPTVTNISTRNPDLFEKESDRLDAHGRAGGLPEQPEIFVRKRRIELKREDQPNETGSLFNPDDERNYLFTSSGP